MDLACCIVFPLLPASFMSSIHTFLGLRLPLFHSVLASSICLGFLSSAILTRCPYQPRRTRDVIRIVQLHLESLFQNAGDPNL
jgi:hypothetical protein